MIRYKFILVIAFILFVSLGIWDLALGISRLWYFIPLTFLLLSIVVGSFSMSYNLFLKAFTQNKNSNKKEVALTFDDGPNAEYTQKVLNLLEKYDAKATFFCIGKNVEANPEILKRIDAAGHSIGNHSYSHNNLIGFSNKRKWLEEISKTDDLMEKTIGRKTKLFRPPYGVTTPNLSKAIMQTGHQVIGWNIRPFDTTTKNPSEVLDRILKRVKSGSIILLHDTHNRIPYILEHLLSYLKKHDYKTVTIETLIDENSL